MSLTISNEQLQAAATQYDTPLYVYHAEKITAQYQQLQQAFEGVYTRFFYACKALTNISVLKHIHMIGCNIDCSSINEVYLALKAGFNPEQILYTSNGIAFEEIVAAVESGVSVNIDSLSNLEKFGKAYGSRYPVGIRLRPNIMAGGNLKISTGHSGSKFGIPLEQLEEILSLKNQYQLRINCLHVHTGSEIKDVDVFIQVADIFFDLVPHFQDLQVLDMGGGFKVPYQSNEKGTDIPLLAKKVGEVLNKFEITYGKKFQVWFEPGKYLVSECGYLITSVNVIKETPTVLFAGINSGFNHLIRPMFYEAYHPIRNISNPSGQIKNYAVTGNICETDNFAWDRPINEIRENDLLVIDNAGAYGFEMGSNYNSRFLPAQLLYKEGEMHLIRKRDTMEDLLKNQIELN
ncbi:MAG: diaminopimelate decarboxylase [Sphingobacteriia bacterium 24-36-13]|jgi:diaminopimelate decarboxylase|uniref:diaminopimelate decarboxylase n=1 Tax=Sediminibacterium sp. TaxID=1917865 RepID=UPI000BCD97EA|nr:diaminopimelate decarboxylase [Sediminibacterium sp.]OYY12058.1 MAG: diaminopimelate decarboxylase [Sphingobacteriia bacterium 35-36-14]OYZ54891.1 MAG: diaminopimelate decarboxylase [Sphingobacteriia bacterium 24-36-13]OZA66161.1 MAG: diaminopimelate decarboxylase [Sphingobacteriia bacterium 39-36-14]HQS24044.1 diaminopimelate decarboxylase [Sediminibacterium sp.]HQS35368.1 diaminopimelate decarboxylase [Sediminibacterium sp.]